MLRQVTLAVLFLWAVPSGAATHIWTGSVNEQFSEPGNWIGGSPAADGAADVSFPPGSRLTVNNDIAGLTLQSISFSGSGYTVRGNAIAMAEPASIFDSTAGPNDIACDVVIADELTVYSTGSTQYEGSGLSLSGSIGGNGGIRLLGGGRLVLTGSRANTYSGVTRVLEGNLQLRKPAGVNAIVGPLEISSTAGSGRGFAGAFANEQIADTAHITVGENGTLGVSEETIGPLTLSPNSFVRTSPEQGNVVSLTGRLVLGADVEIAGTTSGLVQMSGTIHLPATRTFHLREPHTALFIDHLEGATGAGLIVTDDGTSEGPYIADADIRGVWTGPTIVDGGDVTLANPQTSVELRSGRLSGSFRALVATGGTALGGSTRNLDSATNIQLGAGTDVVIESTFAPQPVLLNGTLAPGGARLVLTNLLPDRQFGAVYTIIRNAGSSPVSGAFAGLPEGAVADDRWRVSYSGGDGNDVTLTEAGHLPASVALESIPETPTAGSTITLRATVTPYPAIATPTGLVIFTLGTQELGRAQLVSGVATLNVTLPRGRQTITAAYAGDASVQASTGSRTIPVAAAQPTISSITPSSVAGATTTTLTLRGTNFDSGAYVFFGSSGRPATIVSPTELRVTYTSPETAGSESVRVVYTDPVYVESLPATLTITAPAPQPPSKLVFSSTGVTAPVTPGAMTSWLLIGRSYSGYRERYDWNWGLLTDDDRDGHVTWLWPSATNPMPPAGIWTAVDHSSGEIMAGSPDKTTVPRRRAVGNDVFLRDTAGNFSHVVVPITEWELFQWSRPGVGAWAIDVTDSGINDLDRTPDGVAVFNTSMMQPIGTSPAPPAGVEAGDLFAGINFFLDTQVWFGGRAGDHFGTSSDPSVVSLPAIPYSARESDGVARIPVLRTHSAEQEITVHYALTRVSGQPGAHISISGGDLTFAAGEILKTIEIPIANDELWSGKSEFDVALMSAVGATITGTAVRVAIDDDENPPAVTVSTASSSVMELDNGTTVIPVTIRLAAPALRPLTISWRWREGSEPEHTGVFEFAPGVTQQAFDMWFTANTLPEDDRVLSFSAGYPVGNGGVGAAGSVTITDDDPTTASASDVTVREGETAYLKIVTGYSRKSFNVSFVTSNGSAMAGSDYVSQSSSLTVPAFTSEVVIPIGIFNDSIAERSEYFTVTLTAIDDGIIERATAVVTILDNDTAGLGTPAGLIAAANGTSRVDLSWLEVPDATSYEVHRTAAGAAPTVTSVNSPGYVDLNVVTNRSYVYRVLAVSAAGAKSALSSPDVATTVVFTDHPIVAGATTPKSAHLAELTTAVNAMRSVAGLSSFELSAPGAQNSIIRASHMTQLRTALNEARQQLGLSTLAYTDPTIQAGVTLVKAVHVNEIRQGCR